MNVQGQLSDIHRKNGEAIALTFNTAPRTLQRLLESIKWDEEIVPALKGVNASWIVDFGSPAERIVKFDDENEFDLIVMRTHGRTVLNRILMGSVTEAVARKAKCPGFRTMSFNMNSC